MKKEKKSLFKFHSFNYKFNNKNKWVEILILEMKKFLWIYIELHYTILYYIIFICSIKKHIRDMFSHEKCSTCFGQ